MTLNNIIETGGLTDNFLEIKNINLKTKLAEVTKNKSKLINVDKVRLEAGAGYIIILEYRNTKEIIFIKSKATATEYNRKFRRLLNINI